MNTIKSFDLLPDLLATSDPDKPVPGVTQKAVPTAIAEMLKRHGTAKTARLLCVSQHTLTQGVRNGFVTATIEVAAKLRIALEDSASATASEAKRSILLRPTAQEWATVEPILRALKIPHQNINL